MRLYEITKNINKDLFRTYNDLISLSELKHELKEIKKFIVDDVDLNYVRDLLSKSHNTGQTIDGLRLYALNIGIELAIILYDVENDRIAAFAGFYHAPHIRENLWQAKTVQTFSPYKGKALVGKIYKFCKEELDMSIQSDFSQSQSGEKLWTKILPNLGLNPKIIDMNTFIVYPNDGKINVYDNTERYCWIIEYNDSYRNYIRENTILPYNSFQYLTFKTGKPNSSFY